jgi:hypothetical protein
MLNEVDSICPPESKRIRFPLEIPDLKRRVVFHDNWLIFLSLYFNILVDELCLKYIRK